MCSCIYITPAYSPLFKDGDSKWNRIMTTRFATESQASANGTGQREKMKDTNKT